MANSRRSTFLTSIIFVPALLGAASFGTPDTWVPLRWDGGPLEVARRAQDKTLADLDVREAVAQWYKPETLSLLEGVPVNCLLLSLSAGVAPEVERQQQVLVKAYAAAAHQRGLAVLGLVYPGADASRAAAAAAEARLEGVVLDGEFKAPGFAAELEKALAAANSAAVVIPISKQPASVRLSKAPVIALEGTVPTSYNLADKGVRGSVSTEPWIESNIWLVRSFRVLTDRRVVWISQQPDGVTTFDYVNAVADAAAAGGRWIISLDYSLRANLLQKDADALSTWRSIGGYLKFVQDHAEWWTFEPYAKLAIILDTASANPDNSDEYLHLAARRQVPYRVIARRDLTAQALAGLRGVIAADLAPATDTERKLLTAFAEQGGVVITGALWGNAPPVMPYVELPVGKGRVVVYKDNPPEPDSVAGDIKNLLNPPDLGVTVFNVPSLITYSSTGDSGKRVLVQLLNYSSFPAVMMTVRVNGEFKTARLFTPEGPATNLTIRKAGDRSEISLPKLAVWGAVLFE